MKFLAPVTLASAILASLLPAAASAEPCGKANSTLELRECWGAELARADATLNEVYGDLRNLIASAFPGAGDETLGAETNLHLRDAQRAWITMRDNDCAVAGSAYRGGSLEPVVVAMCMVETTIARTAALDSLAANYRDQ